MKLKNNKVLLLIAAVTLAFFGWTEAAEKKDDITFDKIEIKNNINYDLELVLMWGPFGNVSRQDTKLPIRAGEGKTVPAKSRKGERLSVFSEKSNVYLESIGGELFLHRNLLPALQRVKLYENDKLKGLFTISLRLDDTTLKITIDTLNPKMQYKSEPDDYK